MKKTSVALEINPIVLLTPGLQKCIRQHTPPKTTAVDTNPEKHNNTKKVEQCDDKKEWPGRAEAARSTAVGADGGQEHTNNITRRTVSPSTFVTSSTEDDYMPWRRKMPGRNYRDRRERGNLSAAIILVQMRI